MTIDGKRCVVEYEPDSDLRDTEQVPLLEAGGIEAFIRREVLPHAADAWYEPESVKIGYEISFTRYFYKPQPLRSLEEIRADILALEQETEGLLAEIIGGSAKSADVKSEVTRRRVAEEAYQGVRKLPWRLKESGIIGYAQKVSSGVFGGTPALRDIEAETGRIGCRRTVTLSSHGRESL